MLISAVCLHTSTIFRSLQVNFSYVLLKYSGLTADIVIATLCHGPFALLSTKYTPGSAGFAYRGYAITSCSDAEESLIERMKGGEVPRRVESALANESAEIISTVGKKLGSITVDWELISGAIPMAASDIGAELVRKLQHASQELLEFEINAVS